MLLVGSNSVFSQTYYKARYEKPFTFQVAPTYFNYGGDLFGYQIGSTQGITILVNDTWTIASLEFTVV